MKIRLKKEQGKERNKVQINKRMRKKMVKTK